VAKKKAKAAKKKAAKKKTTKKKKKGAVPSNVANLKKIRAAIDDVVAYIEARRPKKIAAAAPAAATAAAPGEPPLAPDRAEQIVKKLGEARAMVASECCQSDQNCAF
jgi:hypothetical protein